MSVWKTLIIAVKMPLASTFMEDTFANVMKAMKGMDLIVLVSSSTSTVCDFSILKIIILRVFH